MRSNSKSRSDWEQFVQTRERQQKQPAQTSVPTSSTAHLRDTSSAALKPKKKPSAGAGRSAISSTARSAKSGSGTSSLEEDFALQLRAAKLDAGCVREFAFHPSRKWRFDFAWAARKLAVEVEGGIWSGGRHTRGKGFEDDCEKYLEATMLGWTVIRATPSMVKSGVILNAVDALVGGLCE